MDAAAGAAAALALRPPPAAIVFVGTAGSYGETPALEAVAVANTLHLGVSVLINLILLIIVLKK